MTDRQTTTSPASPELLLLFYRQFHDYPERLRRCQSNDPSAVFQLLHDLKGAAAAAGLQDLARQLAPLAGMREAYSDTTIAQAATQLEQELCHLRQLLPLDEVETPLVKFTQLLQQHNAKALQVLQEWQQSPTPPLPEAIMTQLQEQLQQFDFPAARQTLAEYQRHDD